MIEQSGISRDQIGAAAAIADALPADHCLLGDGTDATPERRRHHPGNRQPAPDARQHRQAGGGPLPRARAQQRARRSDHGHLGTAQERVPRQAAGGLWLRSAAEVRLRHGRGHPRHARRAGKGLLRVGRKFPLGHARHAIHGGRLAALHADRPGLDETEPGPPRHRSAGVDSALPGAQRTRSPGRGSATGIVRELHGGRAILARQPGPGVGAFAQRAGHRCPTGPGHAGRPRRRAVAAAHRRLRPYPRPDCAGGSRIRSIQRAGPQARRVLSAQRSPAKDSSPRNPERRTSRSIPCRKIAWSRASW